MEQAISFSIIAGIVISFLLIFALIKDTRKSLLVKIPFVLCVFVFFTHLHAYATVNSISILYYITYLFDYTFFWAAGPFVFIYATIAYGTKTTSIISLSRHLIPALVMLILIFIPKLLNGMFSTDYFPYLEFYQENQNFALLLRNVFFLIYIALALKISLRKRNRSKLNFHFLLIAILLLVVSDLIMRFIPWSMGNLNFDSGYITLVLITILTFTIALNAFTNVTGFMPSLPKFDAIRTSTPFPQDEFMTLKAHLVKIMQRDKYYRNEALNLKLLAESLQVSDKKLSKLLNDGMSTNFNDFVNRYRVDEVKAKLLSSAFEKYTLMALAHDSGFNSKASFYRIFKKHVGLTPREYRIKNL